MWARLPDELARQTAENLVKGTQYVWRDILMSAMYGNYYIVFGPDGQQWDQFRMVAPNPQLVLDLVNDTPGAMLYRSDEGWVALMPPSMNSMLYFQDGAPVWGDPPSAGSGNPSILGNSLVNSTTAFAQAFNYVTGSQAILKGGTTISKVAFIATAASATTKVTPGVYDDLNLAPNNLIGTGPQVTGVVKGLNAIPLTAPISIANDAIVYFAMQFHIANCNVCKSQAGTNFFKANAGGLPNPIAGTTMGSASGNITLFGIP